MNEHDAIEQLAALLDGTADAGDAPASLGSLLTLASTVREHAPSVAPTNAFREQLRSELMQAVAPEAVPPLTERMKLAWAARSTSLRTQARMATATLAASSMLGSAGVAVAAQHAMPGDALYEVKGWTEQARLLLATDDLTEARLHLEFAAERLEELEAVADELTADEIVELLRRMDESSRAGGDALLDGINAGLIDPSELAEFTNQQIAGLSGLYAGLPAQAKPVAEDSLDMLRDLSLTLDTVNATSSDDTFTGRGDALAVAGPSLPEVTDATATTTDAAGDDATPATSVDEQRSDVIEDAGESLGLLPESSEPEGSDEDGTTDPDEEPFQPTGELTGGPGVDNDDDEGSDGGSDVSISEGVSELPADEATATLEATTGVDIEDGPVTRAADAADQLLP